MITISAEELPTGHKICIFRWLNWRVNWIRQINASTGVWHFEFIFPWTGKSVSWSDVLLRVPIKYIQFKASLFRSWRFQFFVIRMNCIMHWYYKTRIHNSHLSCFQMIIPHFPPDKNTFSVTSLHFSLWFLFLQILCWTLHPATHWFMIQLPAPRTDFSIPIKIKITNFYYNPHKCAGKRGYKMWSCAARMSVICHRVQNSVQNLG